MNLLYISYWGVNEGLTSSTVIPHLRILENITSIEKIFFFSVERDYYSSVKLLSNKIIHLPYKSKKGYLSKILDFIVIPIKLIQVARRNGVEFIICRSSLAGTLGYLIHKVTGIRYAVESFEPHSDYMMESGVWSKRGLRFTFQKFFENKQKLTAYFIMPVSNNYRDKLLKEGLSKEKLYLMPCAVDLKAFEYSSNDRIAMRNLLSFSPHDIIGIYVGKFGDIYYKKEAFDLFNLTRSIIKNFRLVILSSDSEETITRELLSRGFPKEDFWIKNVSHDQVPKYLSAADFAFATIKPAPSRQFCSPIKTGEYWANGLIVLISEGVGDDSEIIKQNNIGAIFKEDDMENAVKQIDTLLVHGRLHHLEKIQEVAFRYRNFSKNNMVYREIFNKLCQGH